MSNILLKFVLLSLLSFNLNAQTNTGECSINFDSILNNTSFENNSKMNKKENCLSKENKNKQNKYQYEHQHQKQNQSKHKHQYNKNKNKH